jgi:hypothetical protein
MSYVEEWGAVSARIRSLARVGELYARFQNVQHVDPYGMGKDLSLHCSSILESLIAFNDNFSAVLPVYVADRIKLFLENKRAESIANNSSHWEGRLLQASLVFLLAFESEISFLLAGRQETIRVRSERAFLHLQRLLAVDDDVRTKWRTAFSKKRSGEVSCEKLGAIHLLWHGIYAFKSDAIGARTDLVFNEPIERSLDSRGIDGLVLTEWKVSDQANGLKRFHEAREQAKLYSKGSLGGIELTGYRYAVVVTEVPLPNSSIPNNLEIDGVVWRHINISIEPGLPSMQARLQ